jgi:alkylated DNA repair dioxygenase AlkB
MAWQPSLLGGEIGTDAAVHIDQGFADVHRRDLDHTAWVDVAPAWLTGADPVFDALLTETPWQGRAVRMYDRVLPEPRLTCRWERDHARLPHPVLGPMAEALSGRYGAQFTQIGANLYRDGTDSVAWHGDRVARELPTAIVALVTLGATRPLRLRPVGGGPSVTLLPGPGDLVVMGGSCQRTWQHSVPKVRGVGPRISLQFRHAYPGGADRPARP